MTEDALVKAALSKVNSEVELALRFSYPRPKKEHVVKAIAAVDALRSALKTL